MADNSAVLVGIGVGAAVGVAVAGGLYYFSTRWKGNRPASDRNRRGEEKRRHLKLYHSFPFRSSRCAWLINELGIDEHIEVIPVSLHGPQAKDLPKYKKEVHPHGTIPALVLEDGRVMLESAAICLYLTHEFSGKNGHPQLLPEDNRIADFYDKLVYATSTFDQVLEPLYMQLTHTPEEERDHKLVGAKLRDFKIVASVLSEHFQKNRFVCGELFTATDCVIGYDIWWASVIKKGEFLNDYPVLVSYLQRLKERPSFDHTFVGKRPIKPSGGSL